MAGDDPRIKFRTAITAQLTFRVPLDIDHPLLRFDGLSRRGAAMGIDRCGGRYLAFWVMFAVLPAGAASATELIPYDWTGFYVGLGGGGSWGATKIGTFGARPHNSVAHVSGVPFAFFGGYRVQNGPWVAGLEASLGWAAANGTGPDTQAAVDWTYRSKVDVSGSIEGRFGYAVGNFMPYVLAGPTFASVQYGYDVVNFAGRRSSYRSVGTSRVGWTVGAGAEYALGAWALRTEYRYTDFVDHPYIDQQINTARPTDNTHVYQTGMHEVRAGVSYRFGDTERMSTPSNVWHDEVLPWGGFYLGGQTGYAAGTTLYQPLAEVMTQARLDPGGWSGGVYGGYNLQFGRIVLGIDGDVNFGSVHAKALMTDNLVTPFDGTGGRARVEIGANLERSAAVRGRVGVTIGGILAYVAGGVAFGRFEHDFTFTGGGATQKREWKADRVGWTIGSGLEYRLAKQISLRAEYRYTDYGYEHIRQTPVHLVDLKMHEGRVGVQYHF
jgi:outer membrane immunogenic protein